MDENRIDVMCAFEDRVIGHLPLGMGVVTPQSFWLRFEPAREDYRLKALDDGPVALCPRCRGPLALSGAQVDHVLPPDERRALEEQLQQARAQVGPDYHPKTRDEVRAEIAHGLSAGGAGDPPTRKIKETMLRPFASKDDGVQHPRLVFGSVVIR